MKKYNDIFHSISHYFILFIHDQICEEIISFKFVYILWNEWNRNFWLMYAIRMSLPSTVLQRAPNFSLNPNFRNFFFSWVRSPLRRVRRCERAFADPAISKSISGVKVCRWVILFRVVVFAEDVVRFVEAERVLRCGASSVCAAASSSSPPKQSPPPTPKSFRRTGRKDRFLPLPSKAIRVRVVWARGLGTSDWMR